MLYYDCGSPHGLCGNSIYWSVTVVLHMGGVEALRLMMTLVLHMGYMETLCTRGLWGTVWEQIPPISSETVVLHMGWVETLCTLV